MNKLSTQSDPVDILNIKTQIEKLFDQTDKKIYEEFLKNPSNKNFDEFIQFIELSSAHEPPVLYKQSLPQLYLSPVEKAMVDSCLIKHSRLNELEAQASNENFFSELQKYSHVDLERKGKCLTGLILTNIKQGASGQFLYYMTDPNPNIDEIQKKFSNHSLQIGDRVAFCKTDYSPIIHGSGFIYRFLHNGVVVAVQGFQQLQETKYSLVRQDYQAASFVNHKTSEKLRLLCQPHSPQIIPKDNMIISILQKELIEDLMIKSTLKDKEREAIYLLKYENMIFFDPDLNSDQKHAVKAALAARNVFLIDGPAGTGKTKVLGEFIHQCVKKGLKVLACAPNQVSVDNIVERLLPHNLKCCRIGRPGSIDSKVDSISLDKLIHKNKRVKYIDKECNKILELFRLSTSNQEKQALQKSIEINQTISGIYQNNMAKSILHHSDIVLCTLEGAGTTLIEENDFYFDVVVIDECSQATELACWTPILRGKKVVIAGDRLQLPPFICSQEANRLGFGFSLFERLRAILPKNSKQVLKVQYRMNELIMQWSNRQFYREKLKANDICAQYTLAEYLKKDSPISLNKEKIPVLMLIDTAKFNLYSMFNEKTKGHSFINYGEGLVVLSLIDHLMLNFNLKPEQIGVISPYEAQYELIADALGHKPPLDKIKCHSVDQFQGKEKDVIIISLVRSNKDKKVGFLDNSKRMNVSVTRARRFVAIICDSSTICKPELPFLVDLIDHFRKHGDIKDPNHFETMDKNQKLLEDILKIKLQSLQEVKIENKLKEEDKEEKVISDNKAEIGQQNFQDVRKIVENKNVYGNGIKKDIEEVKVDDNKKPIEPKKQEDKIKKKGNQDKIKEEVEEMKNELLKKDEKENLKEQYGPKNEWLVHEKIKKHNGNNLKQKENHQKDQPSQITQIIKAQPKQNHQKEQSNQSNNINGIKKEIEEVKVGDNEKPIEPKKQEDNTKKKGNQDKPKEEIEEIKHEPLKDGAKVNEEKLQEQHGPKNEWLLHEKIKKHKTNDLHPRENHQKDQPYQSHMIRAQPKESPAVIQSNKTKVQNAEEQKPVNEKDLNNYKQGFNYKANDNTGWQQSRKGFEAKGPSIVHKKQIKGFGTKEDDFPDLY